MSYHESLKEILQIIDGGIIASCQASCGEPLNAPIHINALAQSCLLGGAKALRLEGIENIDYVKMQTRVPIIGLTKDDISEADKYHKVYITRTINDALALKNAGCDLIAIDATIRYRGSDCDLKTLIDYIHNDLDLPVWADIATYSEAINASNLGCDIISTTLYGYTDETKAIATGPAFALLEILARELTIPVVLEGQVSTPDDIIVAFKSKAKAVVVGSAITRPILITRKFVDACKK